MKNAQNNSFRLIDYLKQVPRNRLFLALGASRYTFGDVIDLCSKFKTEHTYLLNKNCAIASEDRESLALFFPVIDSICHSVFLQPSDLKGYESDFYQSADIDYVITLSNRAVSSIEPVKNDIKAQQDTKRAYLLATSGTTGVPKLASYTLEALLSTAKTDVNQGKDFIWGLSYDINRFAGLQVYLQAIASGSALVIPASSLNTSDIVGLFIQESVNSLSGTPSFWRKLLMEPAHSQLPFKRITLGGEISNQSILSALSRSFPSAVIIHIYASTEVGVGFAVKDKQEGFPLHYLDDSVNMKCHLKINEGVLWIKNSNGCSKFLKGGLDIDEDGFVDTGDIVKVENGRVIFLGRASGSINVGGNKVMPEKIESILELHPSVTMAKVFPKSNSVLGALIASEIILNQSTIGTPVKELKREILSFCREQLEPFEVPALMKFVDSIKINATGKKVRN